MPESIKTDAAIAAMAAKARLHRQVNEHYEARKRPRKPPAGSVGAEAPRPIQPVAGGSAENAG